MDGDFVTKVEAVLRKPVVQVIDGRARLCLPDGWNAKSMRPEHATPLDVSTLSSIVQYVEANRDKLELENCVLHVETPASVSLLGPLRVEAEEIYREHFLKAEVMDIAVGLLDHYIDSEDFVVGLLSRFVDTPEREDLLKLVASIRSEKVQETTDTGYSQRVELAQGIVLVGAHDIKNPVHLRARRSFVEIEQPDADYVLRLKESPNGKPLFALFQADGGAWALAAKKAISDWLVANIPKDNPITCLW
jgi:hypothetical protein